MLPTTTAAVATSGTAARGAHLYDPRTGAPSSSRLLAVTITGPSLQLADVLATAAFVAAQQWHELVVLVSRGYILYGIAADGRMVRYP